jgi:hypothetical protein
MKPLSLARVGVVAPKDAVAASNLSMLMGMLGMDTCRPFPFLLPLHTLEVTYGNRAEGP